MTPRDFWLGLLGLILMGVASLEALSHLCEWAGL